jgi:hypothetical protein
MDAVNPFAVGGDAPVTPAAVATVPDAKRPRHWRRSAGAAVVVLAVVFGLFGCTSTITPPRDPAAPTTVFLLREAMHTGLVLPPADGSDRYVEFGFGDWSWFALGNDRWHHAFATVLWPTAGTLARRTFVATDERELRARVSWADLSPLVVDGVRLHNLRTRLEAQFAAELPRAVRRPSLGWTFVPFDRSYWLPQNCADVAAEWFTELGCAVSWVPIRIGLRAARSP